MSHSEMEAELTCPICMELFRQPRRLPCGHSYCHSCISDMLSKNAEQSRSYLSFSRPLLCPECRDEVNLDYVEGIEAIPLDFKLSKLVELFQFMKKSDDSDSDETPSRPVKHELEAGSISEESSLPVENTLPSSALESRNNEEDDDQGIQEYSSSSTVVPTESSFVSSDIVDSSIPASGNHGTSYLNDCGHISPADQQVSFFVNLCQTDVLSQVDDKSLPRASQKGEILSQSSDNYTNYSHSGHFLNECSQTDRSREVNKVDIDESLGAVGGVPLPESHPKDFKRNGLSESSHNSPIPGDQPLVVNAKDDCVSSELVNKQKDLNIGSTLSPSINTAVQQQPKHCAVGNLSKTASSQSYNSILPALNACAQSHPEAHFTRAQSLPLEVTQERDKDLSKEKVLRQEDEKQRRKEEKGRRVGSRKAQNIKKKKGKSLKSFFVDDSSSSEPADDTSGTEAKDSPKLSVPRVKKKRSVARFLKSVFLSDSSSSSNWSDLSDSDDDNDNRGDKLGRKTAIDHRPVSKRIDRPVSDIAIDAIPQSTRVDASVGNVSIVDSSESHRDDNVESQYYRDLRKSHPDRLEEDCKSQPSNPSSTNADDINGEFGECPRSSIASCDSNTQPKEIVPSKVSFSEKNNPPPSSINSDTQPKIVHVDESINFVNLIKPSQEEISISKSNPQLSKIHPRCFDSSAANSNFNQSAALSHYDNVHNPRQQVGISELDLEANPCDHSNPPISPLPAEPTLYDNMNNCPSQCSNIRTLYDNVSDAELVRCRLEAGNSLSQLQQGFHPAQINSAGEIENLKTGFEDMENSAIASRSEHGREESLLGQPQAPSTASQYSVSSQSNEDADTDTNLPRLLGPPCSKEPATLYDNVGRNSHFSRTPSSNKKREQLQPNTSSPPVPNQYTHFCNDVTTSHSSLEPLPRRPASDHDLSSTSTMDPANPLPANLNSAPVSIDSGAAIGACGESQSQKESSYDCSANDSNNNEPQPHNTVEEDDINDEETDPEARMLQPKRKPRSKFRKFITSLLSLSSSSDDDEPYYTTNTSSSS